MKNGVGRGVFITGTDTGIGKTYVSRLLAEGFAYSHIVNYMKPVQTGCTRNTSGDLSAPDLEYVLASGKITDQESGDSAPYRFEPACSPHLAASRAGVTISIDHIREKFNRMANRKSITIVEGAGGVLAPLSETATMADLMLHLRLPVIVVAEPRIGTLNHTSGLRAWYSIISIRWQRTTFTTISSALFATMVRPIFLSWSTTRRAMIA